MISKLSTKLTEQLFRKGLIGNEDMDLYEYAFFVMGSHIFFFILTLIMGGSINIPIESMMFYTSFCCVRRFAGGIHADTEAKCTFFTMLSIAVSMIAIKILIYCGLFIVSMCIMILSTIILVTMSPVDTENKRLSKRERNLYRKKTIVLTIAIAVIFIWLFVLKVYNIAIALSIGMTLASVLLVAGRIKNYKEKHA